jgi:hypothetical protein
MVYITKGLTGKSEKSVKSGKSGKSESPKERNHGERCNFATFQLCNISTTNLQSLTSYI